MYLQSELDGPGLIHLGSEPAECGRHAEVGARSSEDNPIESIDEVRSEVYGYSFVDRSSFDN